MEVLWYNGCVLENKGGVRLRKLPRMMIFDYGGTLLCEPDLDFVRAEKELFRHIKSNPRGVTPEQAAQFELELFERFQQARHSGFEMHEWQFLQTKYDYLGIELAISIPQAEEILWTAASPGESMPHVHELLACLHRLGIRSGVISNIAWSGAALARRINRLLPENEFEFVIASSECGIRKPDPFIFELALRRAGLAPGDVWYCGDNVKADVYGAHSAGIFPVLYKENSDAGEPDIPFEHLHIHSWQEMIALLQSAARDTSEIQFSG